jgi:hypothetical protein
LRTNSEQGNTMAAKDKGGRRLGTDRRRSSDPVDFPERRMLADRRKGNDRRSGFDRRSEKGFRRLIGWDRRRWFNSAEYSTC